MLTPISYHLLSVIGCGEVTVHTLHAGLVADVRSQVGADHLLLNSLLELSEKRVIEWVYYESYGNVRPKAAVVGEPIRLLSAWESIFGHAGPRTVDPETATISVDIVEKGRLELSLEIYDAYRNILSSWY